MSVQEQTVKLMVHSSSGQPQIVKVKTGGKLILLESNSTPNFKLVSNARSESFEGGSGKCVTIVSDSPNVFRVQPFKPKPLSIVQASAPKIVQKNMSSEFATEMEVDTKKMLDINEHRNSHIVTVPKTDLVRSVVESEMEVENFGCENTYSDADPDTIVTIITPEEVEQAAQEKVAKEQQINSEKTNMQRKALLYKKKRRMEKLGKGLRHFSMRVLEKVREKGITSYNEVADELVAEYGTPKQRAAIFYQKNIRRRVYDALNVLLAMNIISKQRKEIKWVGLPTNSLQECIQLLNEKKLRMNNVREKLKRLYDIILHQVSYKRLVQRNMHLERISGIKDSCRLHVPFILVSTSKKTYVDCNISHDKSEYLMLYDDKFEVHDDMEVLKRMNMVMGLDKGECSANDLQTAKRLVPESLEKYVEKIAEGRMEPKPEDLYDLIQSLGDFVHPGEDNLAKMSNGFSKSKVTIGQRPLKIKPESDTKLPVD